MSPALSKGRFAGVIKRHSFHGFPASRGTHGVFSPWRFRERELLPAHVFKGHRMPATMGMRGYTSNITWVDVKEDQNLILLKGGFLEPLVDGS